MLTKDIEIFTEKEINPNTGVVTEKYHIPGEMVTFNLDGIPFTFEDFILEVIREKEKIESIKIFVKDEAPENVLHIGDTIGMDEGIDRLALLNSENVNLVLSLKDDCIQNYFNPGMLTMQDSDIEVLFSIQEKTSGQYFLSDFYFYQIEEILYE